ncbi:nuclear transport factor 2 family protein [Flavobacterium sp.]
MKKILFIFLGVFTTTISAQVEIKNQINETLDSWHKAASEVNFNRYFDLMSEDAIFIGTDATENWTKTAFQAYAKPHFDKGRAWSFMPLERNIYLNGDKTIAWFDELLDTQMKICRGSGVLILLNGKWKIKHYVLSMTVPNDTSDAVIKIKSTIENPLITVLKNKK